MQTDPVHLPLVVRSVLFGRQTFYHANGRGYVDLDDLLEMKAQDEPFWIGDSETGQDITRILVG